MTLITSTSAYNSGNLYKSAGETASTGSSASPNAKSQEKDETRANTTGVTVSLSKEVESAKARESIGLNPTGRLKMGDFQAVADEREKTVSEKLAAAMKRLGIDEDQKISISLDDNDDIAIAESFPGKSELLTELNSDTEFELAFKQLSANKQILNFTSDLTARSASLVNFMNDDSDWDSIISLAKKYEENKAAGNSLGALLGMSRAESPYTYVYDPDTESDET